MPYQWLRFFLEDDEELKDIGDAYQAGTMSTGEVKKKLVNTLVPIVEEHQRRKAMVNDDTVKRFMAVRPLEF